MARPLGSERRPPLKHEPLGTLRKSGMRFQLKDLRRKVAAWAAQYGDSMDDNVPIAVGTTTRERGYPTCDECLSIAHRKSPRTQLRSAQNTEEYIESVTEARRHPR